MSPSETQKGWKRSTISSCEHQIKCGAPLATLTHEQQVLNFCEAYVTEFAGGHRLEWSHLVSQSSHPEHSIKIG
jgi:hypothetical protein